MGGEDADHLGDVHRAAAPHAEQGAALLFGEDAGPLFDAARRRVGEHPGEHGVVDLRILEDRGYLIDHPGLAQPLVGDDEDPGAGRQQLGKPVKGAGTVQQPRRAAELEDILKGHKSVCLMGL